MLNSCNKTIFYSFSAFILFLFIIGLFIKNGNVLAFVSIDKTTKNQLTTKNNKEQAEPLTKEIAPQEGFMAPDITFPDMNGKPVSLSQFRGKIVFLNIWATWCGPCQIEMPAMEKLYKKFKKDDLVILAVSIDNQGKSVVQPFLQELGFTFPVLLSREGRILQVYRINALPSSFIIDKTGRIAARVEGALDWFGDDTIETFEYLIHKT